MNKDIDQHQEEVIHVSGMYKNWFLDYASYVILERAVPHIYDGLKPVQRRILHSLKEMHDGRYHKVANVIGHTMKYHPHGDASIGDAMVQVGQKNLLLDMQGNWGNIATGDKAAAARYIEVRLTSFALDVVYNNKITEWTSSYDGRGKEPLTLPIKFPLLLAHGVEGIAVGLSTKILPHNFNELIDASIKVLKGVKPRVFPDFVSGGMADFSDYNDGKRGGKVRVRARIKQEEKTILKITELPFSTTTSSLINSILKANDKGKIKIKKIEDNTAEDVEILITIPTGISPDKTIDALYRFTDCEVSVSPIGCVIKDDSPIFIGISEILQLSTEHTLHLLNNELTVDLEELQERWHYCSLERIFLENRIYRKIEDLDAWDKIMNTIRVEITPFIKSLLRDITDNDIEKLTEIKIKKITKFDLNRAKQEISNLEDKIKLVKYNLDNLTDYAISYFNLLKKKYGSKNSRRTEIRTFENIDATKVVVASKKLYVNRDEGFIGTSMRKDEFICDCSDIDDIIVFKKDGSMKVVKVDNKVFVGKNIIHCAVFKKKDDRTIYNMIYKDGGSSYNMIKRFPVISVTRGKDYQLTKSKQGSKVLYLTANPNGEAEIINIFLRKSQRLRTLRFDVEFANINIKSKVAVGNIVSKHPIRTIEIKSEGFSTLSARKIWFDDNVSRLNIDGRGTFLGDFKANDKIITINQKGFVELKNYDIANHFDDDMILIEKFNIKKPISVIYFDAKKQLFFVKRFIADDKIAKTQFINEDKDSYLELVSSDWIPMIEVVFVKEKGKERKKKIINLEKFIKIKGVKATGNKLASKKIKEINLLEPLNYEEGEEKEIFEENLENKINDTNKENNDGQITLEL